MAHNLLSSFLSGTVLLSTKLVEVFLLLAAPPPPHPDMLENEFVFY